MTTNPVGDALRQHADALLSAAGSADEEGAEIVLAPDEARRLATLLFLASEMVDGQKGVVQPGQPCPSLKRLPGSHGREANN